MYTSLRVQNFRGFRDLQLDDLGRVNLIAGKNNAGKTTLLESVFIFTNPYNPQLPLSTNVFRGLTQIELSPHQREISYWDHFFHKFSTDRPIVITGAHTIEDSRKLEITIEQNRQGISHLDLNNELFSGETTEAISSLENINVPILQYNSQNLATNEESSHTLIFDNKQARVIPNVGEAPFQAVMIGVKTNSNVEEISKRFSQLELRGRIHILLEALRNIDTRIEKLSLLYFGGIPLIHGDIGIGRLLPLQLMGEGMSRLASIIVSMGIAENGILLIDEIENGLHYSVQEDVWKAIGQAAKDFNVQVFATTHSLEMIRAAHEAFKDEDPYDYRYHRLDKNSDTGDIEAVTYNELGMDAIASFDYEVRG
jgi:AAA15 family ATPase/GTPase